MTLIETSLFEALGWALFHFLWQGSVIALALSAGLWVFRPLSARLRYGLACAAMVSMLVSFGLTLTLAWPRSGETNSTRGPQAVRHRIVPAPPRLPDVDRAAPDESSRLERLVPFWILGVGLFVLRSLVNWFGARRLRNVGVCAAPEQWQRKLAQLAERIQVSRPVVLLESCLTEVPAVIGFLRPVILAPAGLLAGFPPDQLELILIHELAHIRRYDYLVNLLQSLMEDLLFYHPAVWWVSGLVRSERENCCDDVVVNARGDAHGLAAALTALEDYRWAARETVLAANGGHLMNRIRRLLEGKQGPRVTAAPVFFAALFIASLALAGTTHPVPAQTPAAAAPQPLPAPLPALASPPAERRPPKVLAQAAQTTPETTRQAEEQRLGQILETPYRKWLDQDVVYIISKEERFTFTNLRSDEERQHFIEQFWLLRDPTPGTPENEFREEYYRRLAFVERFAYQGTPGWKTDRGRAYIAFGPPDEIDSHGAGTYQRTAEEGGGVISTFPFEKWRYRYIEGTGTNVYMEFVDPAMTGEYRMAKDPKEKER
jgi:GWxTD domain-containing protein